MSREWDNGGVSTEFTLRQIRYFIAVAEAGSLSAASERIFVSQPALSSALTELESSLGVQLCVRQKARGVILTPNGQSFYERARQLVRNADELTWTTKTDGGPLRGPLTIGCYASLATELIPHYLTEFPKHQPQVLLNYAEGSTVDLEHMLLQGEADLAILYDLDLDPRLRRQTLFEKFPRVVLPQNHELAGADSIPLAAIQDEPFIQMVTSPAISHTAALFAEAGIVPNIRYHAKNAYLAEELVANNLGYTILTAIPPSASKDQRLPLVYKQIDPCPQPVRVVVAWPAAVTLSERAQAFLEFLVQNARPANEIEANAHDRRKP